jgi:DNA ligase (NAD+)
MPHNIEIMDTLMAHLTIPNFIVESALSSPLTGKTIVFTGSLTSLSRAEAKAKAERFGAKVTSTVTHKTDYVIEGADAGSKAKAARTLGIAILTEDEFIRMGEGYND